MAREKGKAAARGGGACPGMASSSSSEAAAAEESAETRGEATEQQANVWVMVFYLHQALQAFRAGRTRDFRQLRDVMNAVLVRPLVLEKSICLRLRIVQFLSRIEEDWTIDAKTKLTPLECALQLLDKMKEELKMEESVFQKIRKQIKEAAVITCVKNKEYEQASKILKKHLSKDESSQEMRTLLQSIIAEKNFSHPVIWNFSYPSFQQTMFMFMEGYLDDSEPFLLKMAQKRLAEKSGPRFNPVGAANEAAAESKAAEKEGGGKEAPEAPGAADPEPKKPNGISEPEGKTGDLLEEHPRSLEGDNETDAGPLPADGESQKEVVVVQCADVAPEVATVAEPPVATDPAAGAAVGAAAAASSPVLAAPKDSDRQPPGRPTSYGYSVLKEAHRVLCGDAPNPDEVFLKLDETDWTCPKLGSPSTSHRAKRPREEEEEPVASGSHSCQQNAKQQVTINKLLMGKENGSENRRAFHKELFVALSILPSKPQRPAQPAAPLPARLAKERVDAAGQDEEKEVWSGEDELFIDEDSEGRGRRSTCIASNKKKKWTVEESAWVKAGVRRFGEGNWKAICRAYPFKKRTPVMIKDRWRTMKKLGL
ncbi:telomeric repeat-binding factor 2 isoform X1 [Pogona vitticeps]